MSQFLKNIMAVPILIGKADCKQVCDDAADMAYKLRDSLDKGSLVSDDWDKSKKSNNKEDFLKKGVTSFNSADNLFDIPGWENISHFLYSFAKSMVETIDPQCADKMRIINMWSTIYPKGCFIPEHVHSNSTLSAVFYVKAPENCGEIVFHDPSWVAKTMHWNTAFPSPETKYTQKVEDGLMIIFPSWLPHRSYANQSEEDRIIISFNIDFPNRVDK